MKALPAILWFLTCAVAFGQQSTTNATTVGFQSVDVFVDSGSSPLAAYQFEFAVTRGSAKIVGIEGGEHTAFAQPPFYDPKAMQQERVVLAAYSTNSENKLPKGRTRVATIHLQVSGRGELKFETKLQTAASSNGVKIKAELSIEGRSVK
jgi:hypothetical protein